MTERIICSRCKDSHLDEVSKELMRQALQCVTTKGEFHLAMSESSLLDDFYARLMCDPEMRAMPWEKIHVCFFGESSIEDSIQHAVATHSGIPEDQVQHVRDGLPERIQLDCCISDGNDLSEFPEEYTKSCVSWLIIAPRDAPTLNLSGVTHVFVINDSSDN